MPDMVRRRERLYERTEEAARLPTKMLELLAEKIRMTSRPRAMERRCASGKDFSHPREY